CARCRSGAARTGRPGPPARAPRRASARTPGPAPRAAPAARTATATRRSRRGPRESGQGFEPLPRDHARLPAHFLTLPEHEQRRNGTDPEPMRGRRVAVGVELHDQYLALAVAREVVEHGRHDLAGATPVGVPIQDDGYLRALEDRVERRVRDRDGTIEQDRPPTAGAFRTVGNAGEIHQVDLPAERASDGCAFADFCDRHGSPPSGIYSSPSTIASASISTSISGATSRSEEHTSELQSPYDLVCRLL